MRTDSAARLAGSGGDMNQEGPQRGRITGLRDGDHTALDRAARALRGTSDERAGELPHLIVSHGVRGHHEHIDIARPGIQPPSTADPCK
jgi:hypothetical protein